MTGRQKGQKHRGIVNIMFFAFFPCACVSCQPMTGEVRLLVGVWCWSLVAATLK